MAILKFAFSPVQALVSGNNLFLMTKKVVLSAEIKKITISCFNKQLVYTVSN